MNWLLPENLADALPHEAAQIERLRRSALDLFQRHGYEQIMPPLLEYLDALLTGSGSDLKLRTFKLVDQISGRTLGVRADITPQAARIDAQLLNRPGVTRLCYCDSVLHTLPATQVASREPIQLGIELYAYAGVAADIEVIRLLAATLKHLGAPAARIDIGHVGVFCALAEALALSVDDEAKLLQLLQSKDLPTLQTHCAEYAEPYRSALLLLPQLYGDAEEVLTRAQQELPALAKISGALAALNALSKAMPNLPLSFDLADLRGYHYHNGVVFAAYYPNFPSAIARGGRYDGVGKTFGRDRAATGFSMDLREIARLAPMPLLNTGIVAPYAEHDSLLGELINSLRAQGERVIELLPDEQHLEHPQCNRRITSSNGQWIIQEIN
ncbi:MAG: ATP phosphoribosyltransferase regulatory subunit [Pseudomonadota bacterium]